MAGVVFIFVREDASEAEALAEAFDAAGYAITGSDANGDALSVVLWSRAALRSSAFQRAAEQALRAGKAVIASLATPPSCEQVFNAPVVDLTGWGGEADAALDPLFEAADSIVRAARANVIALPARPLYEDAEFTEVSPQIASVENEQADRARRSWEAPIPTEMLRPMRDEPPAKLGAPSPRRNFRRMSQRRPNARAHAAVAFAMIALIGGGVFALSVNPAPEGPAASVRVAEDGGVSLTSASAGAMGLEDDVAPNERPPLFEPAPQRGHAGLEPPSARSIRSAAYVPRRTHRDDRAANQAPALIPESIAADLDAPVLVAEHASGPRS